MVAGPAAAAGRAARRRPPDRGADAVYLPACVNTMFGPADGGPGVQVSFERALRAGRARRCWCPPQIESMCCGTPWSSKGIPAGYAAMRERVLPAARAATRDGRAAGGDPTPPRAPRGSHAAARRGARPPVAGARRRAVRGRTRCCPCSAMYQRLRVGVGAPDLLVDPAAGSTPPWRTLAAAVAEDVHVPQDWGCCAFAGDRGHAAPRADRLGHRAEARRGRRARRDAHVSCNRTCELGMTRATGRAVPARPRAAGRGSHRGS